MKEDIHVDECLLKSFHLMWDHFPECVQLSHKSYQVVAVNPAAGAIGREVGMLCAKHGPTEAHRGCLAQKTLKHQMTTWAAAPPAQPGKVGSVTFWLPIDGYPDFFLHFAVGYVQDYTVPQALPSRLSDGQG
ncbi:MAG: hypothetical protein LBW85_10230 [Deltaproteobacteria bacterium]|jgi:hypothetical protein|nr:hypothetical protein [Deltaproteobacteria bacterium]